MITKAVRNLMNKAVRVLTYDNVNVVFSESLLIPYVFSYFVSHTSDVTVCVECGHECGVPRPRGGKRGISGGRPRCQRCRSGSGVLVALAAGQEAVQYMVREGVVHVCVEHLGT